MSWTSRDVRSTAVSVAAQAAGATAVAAAFGVVWSRFDGTAWVQRWSDLLIIGGVLWLVGCGTLASKITVLDYMRWGISGPNATLFGDDIGGRELGVLTPLGEGLVVGALLVAASVLIG